jgi:hypothetical protein
VEVELVELADYGKATGVEESRMYVLLALNAQRDEIVSPRRSARLPGLPCRLIELQLFSLPQANCRHIDGRPRLGEPRD